MRYVAFLRAVNVGGRTVKMAELAKHVSSQGFGNVSTFIASGNVLFDAPGSDGDRHARRLEKSLEGWLGFPVAVMARTFPQLEAMVASNPFKGELRERDAKLYVSFLWADPKATPKVPIVLAREGLKLFRLEGREAFGVSSRLPGGKFGVPDFEKLLGMPVTTRNWNTVRRILDAEKLRG
ncbi:DUF1697 domain-containing protein [Usitatibacter palustris]|uniref:DUF1697 domain-containing protein n=1 Tax=Usitatibacter palustris TaxID=2732487 RepID=A0A6M4H9F3_9PROT|nr:DUF1697 domain-containing protein [Usitatibacter palustris]QJR15825.1 hypothetical protein DSM104440_02651 [Usitatibacter palustris]